MIRFPNRRLPPASLLFLPVFISDERRRASAGSQDATHGAYRSHSFRRGLR